MTKTLPNLHSFDCSDTPGVFECPECPAWAHKDQNFETGYCVHPADRSAEFHVDLWTDERVLGAHEWVTA